MLIDHVEWWRKEDYWYQGLSGLSSWPWHCSRETNLLHTYSAHYVSTKLTFLSNITVNIKNITSRYLWATWNKIDYFSALSNGNFVWSSRSIFWILLLKVHYGVKKTAIKISFVLEDLAATPQQFRVHCCEIAAKSSRTKDTPTVVP